MPVFLGLVAWSSIRPQGISLIFRSRNLTALHSLGFLSVLPFKSFIYLVRYLCSASYLIILSFVSCILQRSLSLASMLDRNVGGRPLGEWTMTTSASARETTATTKCGVYGYSSELVSLSAENSSKVGVLDGLKKSPSRKCTLQTGKHLEYQIISPTKKQ